MPGGSGLWKCDVCGYIHKGDDPPRQCPVCGVGAEMFSAFAVAAAPAPPPAAGPAPARAVEVDVGRVIVLGAGIAGLTAAEHARAAAPEVALTIITREPGLPYYRLNLTRHLAGEIAETDLGLADRAWLDERRIELLAEEALSIDRRRQEVRLASGRVLPYDRLVVATGAHAFVPPIAGVTREGVHTLRTLADCRALLARTDGRPAVARRAVCIGGGLLGLETAGALARRGVEVTVVESFGWLLPRQLAERAGRLLESRLRSIGLAVRTAARVEEIVGDERVRGVRLQGEAPLPADLVLVTAGVRPNSYLLRLSGLEVKSGVVVDDRLVSSDPAILAAGDVAEHRGIVYGIWPAAYAQGAVAGTNAVGGSLEFRGLPPENRLKVLEVDVFSVGEVQPPDGSYEVFEAEPTGTSHVRLVCRDGQLVGATLYGDTSLSGPLKAAVESRVQLAASPELLQRLPPALRQQSFRAA